MDDKDDDDDGDDDGMHLKNLLFVSYQQWGLTTETLVMNEGVKDVRV